MSNACELRPEAARVSLPACLASPSTVVPSFLPLAPHCLPFSKPSTKLNGYNGQKQTDYNAKLNRDSGQKKQNTYNVKQRGNNWQKQTEYKVKLNSYYGQKLNGRTLMSELIQSSLRR